MTATSTMTPTEQAQVSRDFLSASDDEFVRGDILQGAEKLWGAAAHAVMAVARERKWSHESHRSLKNAVIRLAEEYDDPLIRSNFLAAEKFHRHFYHDSMEDWERDSDRPLVHDFVERVLRVTQTD